jgi:choline monooxygenase
VRVAGEACGNGSITALWQSDLGGPDMSNADYVNVLRPVATASGLPNEHYISDEMFATERKKVLFDNWSAIGFAKDVAEAGDANPITFLEIPLLVVRHKDQNVRVYQNTCRHRGMILVEEKKKIGGVIRCPYHSWCYALTGELITTPHVGGPGTNKHAEIRRDDLGLVEIRSHVWRDIIFVNISKIRQISRNTLPR